MYHAALQNKNDPGTLEMTLCRSKTTAKTRGNTSRYATKQQQQKRKADKTRAYLYSRTTRTCFNGTAISNGKWNLHPEEAVQQTGTKARPIWRSLGLVLPSNTFKAFHHFLQLRVARCMTGVSYCCNSDRKPPLL